MRSFFVLIYIRVMTKDPEKFPIIEPPPTLFKKVILAIKKEEARRQKRLIFGFFSLFLISFTALPFSFELLLSSFKNSGVIYFISTALSNFKLFLNFWKDFSLAILEVLPIGEISIFLLNVIVTPFAFRLFFYKRGTPLAYLVSIK